MTHLLVCLIDLLHDLGFVILWCRFLIFFLPIKGDPREQIFKDSESSIPLLWTQQIVLEKFPTAFNPSIIEIPDGILMSFRFSPDPEENESLSYIGVVLLDEKFNPILGPELLNVRPSNHNIQSQAEDPRLFSYKNRVFLIYNDNLEMNSPGYSDQRFMFLRELFLSQGSFEISSPLKLIAPGKTQYWEKNWSPFESQDALLLCYSMNPHEILSVNFMNGECYTSFMTERNLPWNFGQLRLTTPPVLYGENYIAFFHSSLPMLSEVSLDKARWHYFMGAYIFSSSPPYEILSYTKKPIIGEHFYTTSDLLKRVVYPGGCIFKNPYLFLAYGKDDQEIWIACFQLSEDMLVSNLSPSNSSTLREE